MKINISILSEIEIDLKEIIPVNYWNFIENNSIIIYNPNFQSDWISIEPISNEISIIDFSENELAYVKSLIGNIFFTKLVTLKFEFANSILEVIINNLKMISNNKILIVVYSKQLKILNINNYIELCKLGTLYN